MGLLIDGTWHDKWYDTDSTGGKFVRSESQFRASFELAGVGKAQIDAASGKFMRVNDCYCEIVGYSADGVLRLRVSAPPVDGKANEAVIRLLAKRSDIVTPASAGLKRWRPSKAVPACAA